MIRFLVSLIMCFLFLLMVDPLKLFAQIKDKPNIIFLMTDDQRCDNMGCYGKPEFNTPNIDRLAEEGVVFDKAFYAVAILYAQQSNDDDRTFQFKS